jgi:superfamily II RNA helicase
MGKWKKFRGYLVSFQFVIFSIFRNVGCWTKSSHSKMTDVYEGSLIRLFRRLEELLRQMAQAGKVMGSEELSSKFEESLTKIKRDIVAAQSLYL